MVLQDPLEPGGEGEDGNGDAGEDGEQKAGVDCFKCGGEVEAQERVPERAACAGANAHHELFVDSENEGHGPAGDAGYDIGAAHGEAAGGEAEILSQRPVRGEAGRSMRIRDVRGLALPGSGMGIGGHRGASA